MGNDMGKGANRMAIAAMAHVVKFNKDELLALQKQFNKLAKKNHNNDHTISRSEFQQALKLVGIVEADAEILNRIFTMIDEVGDEQINFKEFVVGVAPIVRGNLLEKLEFAFHLYDTDNTGQVSKDEFKKVLSHMNSAVSYFGDDMLDDTKVNEIADQIYEECDHEHDGQLSYSEFMEAVAKHPHIVEFVAGHGEAAAKKAKDETK